ncbi:hypothetical protein O1611_g4141 [Lasiodiplodia mahajangana]|uniref:Uncharacterized protein n=1 Tax=Lasiodiplodia mahajangana TaxID=1108764 RepID=A0ACC2JPZ0_9PEZI|nr:hypothetical protein O1611_g4141 [Lasiodiplodia mahajangana]
MTSRALERALQKFRDGLTQEQRQQFGASSIDDVKAEIWNIQNRLGSMKKLRSLRRISQFLEALGQIEQLVHVFLNVSNVVGFIWGPIKFALLVATARVESLECLLDTYVEVGEVIPSLQQYDQLFRAAPCVLEVLEKYFCDILEFHQNALDVFARPAWRKFFDATWKAFRTNFKPILESLKRHKALLHDLKADAAVLEIQVSRSQTLDLVQKSSDRTISGVSDVRRGLEDAYRKLSDQIYDLRTTLNKQRVTQQATVSLQQVNTIINKLDPPNTENDQYTAFHSCHEQSGRWIFADSTYLKWIKSATLQESVLFIHGMPGAGKTLLASRIISHLRSLPGITCLFFYFKQSDDTKTSMNYMLRALLIQLITRDAGIAPELYQKCCVVSDSEARQLPSLKAWMTDLLKSQRSCMIILDGLDECNHKSAGDEAQRILDWLTMTVIPDAEKEGSQIHLLALGQRDGIVDAALSKYPSIRLDDMGAHLDDIHLFTRSRASEIGERFGLESAEELTIIEKVTMTAKGMFLYAKVVTDNLMAQGSLEELYQELKVKFPAGLDEAYERVAYRVLDNPIRHQTRRDAAAKILHPHMGVCKPRNRRVDNCKILCGSFVEVDEHDPDMPHITSVVNLVHDTARRYLIQTRRVDLVEANAAMALFSSAYLTSIPFDKNGDHEMILSNALTGYYGLQDYMISSWESHMTASLDQAVKLPPETKNNLLAVLVSFLKYYRLGSPSEDGTMKGFLDEESLACLVGRLEEMASAIRKVTEEIRLSDQRSPFLSLNGKPGYKCPKLKCLMFSQNFEGRKARDMHVSRHHNQFTCCVNSCLRQTLGFSSSLELQKHDKDVHSTQIVDSDMFPTIEKPNNAWWAVRKGDIDFIKDFHKEGGDLNNPGGRLGTCGAKTLLRVAAQHSQLEICRYLVHCGFSIFHAGNAGFPAKTALGEAINRRDTKLFRLLLSLTPGEETKEFINGKALAIHYAAAINCGDEEIINTMSAFVSSRENQLRFDDLFYEIAKYRWIEHKRSPEVYDALYMMVDRNVDGNTPLHAAIDFPIGSSRQRDQQLAVVRIFLDTGVVDLTGRNNLGKTVFDLTKSRLLLSTLHAAEKKQRETLTFDDISTPDRPPSPPPADPRASSPH